MPVHRGPSDPQGSCSEPPRSFQSCAPPPPPTCVPSPALVVLSPHSPWLSLILSPNRCSWEKHPERLVEVAEQQPWSRSALHAFGLSGLELTRCWQLSREVEFPGVRARRPAVEPWLCLRVLGGPAPVMSALCALVPSSVSGDHSRTDRGCFE